MSAESTGEVRAQRAVDAANHAIKYLFLLNGGAAVAALGFVASTISSAAANPEIAAATDNALDAILYFGIGLVCVTLMAVFAYYINRLDFELIHRDERNLGRHYWWSYRIVLLLLAGSFGFFILGLLQVLEVH